MIGETIDKRYQVESLLGRGGMGAVYRALDLVEKRPVALKVLHFFLDDESQAAQTRFQREFRVLARLEHPHIMQAYAPGSHNDVPYLALEFLPGKTLTDVLAEGPLQRSQVLHITRQLGEALIHLHAQSIVHRDLKPGNLMLLSPEDDPYLKVMDFGLVRQTNLSQLTEEGVALGTVAYMAPEQAQGLPVDFRADLYAVGIILYEMVAGRPPFNDDNPAMLLMQQLINAPPPPSQFKSDLDEGLEKLILELLAKEPAQRPHSTDVLVTRLAKLANETAPVVASATNQAGLIPRVPLIGRQASLDALAQHWRQAHQGQGQVVFLAGTGGAGKSRLLTEVSLQVKLGGGRFLSCRCREYAALPYQPFVDALELLLNDLTAAARAQLPAELSVLVPDGKDDMSEQQGPTDQSEAQRRLFAAYWDLLMQTSQSKPLMLVIEDGQWADPATVDLLSYLAHRLEHAPILLVLSYRPEEVNEAESLDRLQRDFERDQKAQLITLGLLSREQVAEFLGAALGKAYIPDAVVDRFHQATSGNPLFIEETLKLYAIQVQLHFLQGDLSAASAAFDEIQFDVIKYTNLLPLSNFVIPVIACEISLKLGAYDQVIKIADDFIVRRSEAGARVGLADFHYLKGQVFRAQDEFEEARQALISARTEAEASGARRIWWKVLVALAEMEGRLGSQPTAAALRQEARTILDDIIEQIPEGEMRDSFVALPAVSDLKTG